jgi:hypothetical protein
MPFAVNPLSPAVAGEEGRLNGMPLRVKSIKRLFARRSACCKL